MATLAELFKRFGAVWVGGELRACCVVCQPHEDDPARFRARLGRGEKRPLLLHCFHCVTDGDRDRTRYWVWLRAFLEATHTDPDDLYDLDPAEAVAGWESVGRREPAVPAADPDTLHGVYTDVLARLDLTDRHRRWLDRRGLDPDHAHDIGYRSTPADGCFGGDVGGTDGAGGPGGVLRGIGETLHGKWGRVLDSVPGFLDGGRRVLFRFPAVLHPCRDARGRILALKQRLTDGKGGRMRMFSSGPMGGAAAVAFTHVPLGVGGREWDCVWVTEGERKADVFWHRTGTPAVAVPGVHATRTLPPTLTGLLRPGGTAVLALDTDPAGKGEVDSVAGLLAGAGYRVEVAGWEGVKGLDDAVTGGRRIDFREWNGAERRHTPIPTDRPARRQRYPKHLRDSEVVAYLAERGPQLREAIPTKPSTIDYLLARKAIRIVAKGPQGQILGTP
jgi:hypothetical protein